MFYFQEAIDLQVKPESIEEQEDISKPGLIHPSEGFIEPIEEADIVVVNFTVLSGDKYHERLARLSGANAGSLPAGKKGGRHFNAVYGECLRGIKKRARELKKLGGKEILHNIENLPLTPNSTNSTGKP